MYVHGLSTAFPNRVLYLLPILLGWQAWRVFSGNTRGQWSPAGELSGLLVFPTTTNCILTVGFPFPSQFFFYGRRKTIPFHLTSPNTTCLPRNFRRVYFCFRVLRAVSGISTTWLTFVFCVCACSQLQDVVGCFPSVCMNVFMQLISQKEKPFWILALRWWECRAALLCLEMNGKKPQVDSLFSYLSQSSFFTLFPFAEYTSFILVWLYEEKMLLPLSAGKWWSGERELLAYGHKRSYWWLRLGLES